MQNDLNTLKHSAGGDHPSTATLLLLADVQDEATLNEIIADLYADVQAGHPIRGVDPTNVHASWIHVVACTHCQSQQEALLGYSSQTLAASGVESPALSSASIAAAIDQLSPATHAAKPDSLERTNKPAASKNRRDRRFGVSAAPQISGASSSGAGGLRLPWILAGLAVVGGVAIALSLRSSTTNIGALPAKPVTTLAQAAVTEPGAKDTVAPDAEAITSSEQPSLGRTPPAQAKAAPDTALGLEASAANDKGATEQQKDASASQNAASAMVEKPGSSPAPAPAGAVPAGAVSADVNDLGSFPTPASALTAFIALHSNSTPSESKKAKSLPTANADTCPQVTGTIRATATVEGKQLLVVRGEGKAGAVDIVLDVATCTELVRQDVIVETVKK